MAHVFTLKETKFCDTVLKQLHVNLFIHSVLVTSRPTLRHYSPGIILQK